MRILHSSDWHLGVTLHGASRQEEQARFLEWLAALLTVREVDALVIAGDVFDQYQPSAEAQALFYGFLARLAASDWPRHVIVVGGNHDSAARLEAPREVLGALRVTVVGGYERGREPDLPCVVRHGSEILGVVLPVPFVHEHRLGVRAIGLEAGALATQIAEAFTGLYARLAERAAREWPGVPLVATGHLTAGRWEEGDFHTPLHQAGGLHALPDGVFDARYDYVALGHIHRSYRVGGTRAWYSGTPVAVGVKEASSPRLVLLVEVSPGGGPEVEPIEVPCARRILPLDGPLDEVIERWRRLEWTAGELPPYVLATLRTDVPLLNPGQTLIDARPGAEGGPRLVHVEQRRASAPRVEAGATIGPPPLRDLTPWQVFELMHQRAHEGHAPDDALHAAFHSLLAPGGEA